MQARTGDPTKAASPQATAVSQSAPVAETVPAPVATPEEMGATPVAPAVAPAVEPAKAETTGDAADILAMIRQRQAQ